MLPGRLVAECSCVRRSRLRLPRNVAPAWRDDKRIADERYRPVDRLECRVRLTPLFRDGISNGRGQPGGWSPFLRGQER